MVSLDRYNRPLRSLRISVTDRCNLRCQYCMPEQEYVWLPKQHLLTFEEIGVLVDAFSDHGVDRVRITGGEPLLRRDLHVLVSELSARAAVRDLALTTNGVLLKSHARQLRDAGLDRVTVSLDTLKADRFQRLTRMDEHASVLAGLDAAADAGFSNVKLDSVIIRGVNDDELIDLMEFSRARQAEVRFIEYMDVGGATRWSAEDVVSRQEMLQRIAAHYGAVEPLAEQSSAPATRFVLPDGLVFGIISSTTEPFCATCDRSRLTADGVWLLCLYAQGGTDLRGPLRASASRTELSELIGRVWSARTDRGAEDRLLLEHRSSPIPVEILKKDAHLEMHTRGG